MVLCPIIVGFARYRGRTRCCWRARGKGSYSLGTVLLHQMCKAMDMLSLFVFDVHASSVKQQLIAKPNCLCWCKCKWVLTSRQPLVVFCLPAGWCWASRSWRGAGAGGNQSEWLQTIRQSLLSLCPVVQLNVSSPVILTKMFHPLARRKQNHKSVLLWTVYKSP